MDDRSKKSSSSASVETPVKLCASFVRKEEKQKGGNEKEIETDDFLAVLPKLLEPTFVLQANKEGLETQKDGAVRSNVASHMVNDGFEKTGLTTSDAKKSVAGNSDPKPDRTIFTFNSSRSPADFFVTLQKQRRDRLCARRQRLYRDTHITGREAERAEEGNGEPATTTNAKPELDDKHPQLEVEECKKISTGKRKHEQIDEEDSKSCNVVSSLFSSKGSQERIKRICSESPDAFPDKASADLQHRRNAVECATVDLTLGVEDAQQECNRWGRAMGSGWGCLENIGWGSVKSSGVKSSGVKSSGRVSAESSAWGCGSAESRGLERGSAESSGWGRESAESKGWGNSEKNDLEHAKKDRWDCAESSSGGCATSWGSSFIEPEKRRKEEEKDTDAEHGSTFLIQNIGESESPARGWGAPRSSNLGEEKQFSSTWTPSGLDARESDKKNRSDTSISGWSLGQVFDFDPNSGEETRIVKDNKSETPVKGLLHSLLQKQNKQRQESKTSWIPKKNEACFDEVGKSPVALNKKSRDAMRQARLELIVQRRAKQRHRAARRKKREESKKIEMRGPGKIVCRIATSKKEAVLDEALYRKKKLETGVELSTDAVENSAPIALDSTSACTVESTRESNKRKHSSLSDTSHVCIPRKRLFLEGKLKHLATKYSHWAEKVVPLTPCDAAETVTDRVADVANEVGDDDSTKQSGSDLYHELLQYTIEHDTRKKHGSKSTVLGVTEECAFEDKKASPSNSVIDLTTLSEINSFEGISTSTKEDSIECKKMPSDLSAVQKAFFGATKVPAEKNASNISTSLDSSSPTFCLVPGPLPGEKSDSESDKEHKVPSKQIQEHYRDDGMMKLKNLCSVANDFLEQSNNGGACGAKTLTTDTNECVTGSETETCSDVSETLHKLNADASAVLAAAENNAPKTREKHTLDEAASCAEILATDTVFHMEANVEDEAQDGEVQNTSLSMTLYGFDNRIVEAHPTASFFKHVGSFFASMGRVLVRMIGHFYVLFTWFLCLAHVIGKQLECHEDPLSSRNCGWEACHVSIVELFPFPIMLFWIVSEFRLAKSERDFGGIALLLFQGMLCLTAVSISIRLLAKTNDEIGAESMQHCFYTVKQAFL